MKYLENIIKELNIDKLPLEKKQKVKDRLYVAYKEFLLVNLVRDLDMKQKQKIKLIIKKENDLKPVIAYLRGEVDDFEEYIKVLSQEFKEQLKEQL